MAVTLLASGSERAVYGTQTGLQGASAMSVAVTLKPSAATATSDRIVAVWDHASTTNDTFILSVEDTNELAFAVRNSTFGWLYGLKTTDVNLASGTQYRILCRWIGNSAISIYVNGSSVSTTAWLGSSSILTLPSATEALKVGYHNFDAVACVDGDYSEVAVWKRSLSDGESVAVTTSCSPALFPRDRVMYDSMINKNTVDVHGTPPTYTGGANAAHSKIIYPSAQILQFPPTAAGGGFSPYWAAGSNVIMNNGSP